MLLALVLVWGFNKVVCLRFCLHVVVCFVLFLKGFVCYFHLQLCASDSWSAVRIDE